ncbi:MAG: MraY family glycosyltransferase [Varibaculum sp.]|nr:MraY family glycosyltransferase [Varibaculum sp.]
MRTYMLLALLALAVTVLFVPIVRRAALVFGALTPVRTRDVHTRPIPRLGGVAMLLGFAVAIVFASSTSYLSRLFVDPQGWTILIGGVAICLLGVIDDLWELDWWAKLAGQMLIAGSVTWGGVQMVSVPVFGMTVGSVRLGIILTVLVTVVAINAVNFVDGLDGLAAGTVGIGGLAFFLYSYLLIRLSNSQSYASLAALEMAIMVGICAGFLVFNFHPASIFMGDSGSMLLGYLTAVAFITVTGQINPELLGRSQILPALLPILLPLAVLLLPLLDTIMAVSRRLLAGESPFHPDRMHLHHRLLALGHSHSRAVLIMYLWAAAFALPAVALIALPAFEVLIGFLVAIVVSVLITVIALPGLRRRGHALEKHQ